MPFACDRADARTAAISFGTARRSSGLPWFFSLEEPLDTEASLGAPEVGRRSVHGARQVRALEEQAETRTDAIAHDSAQPEAILTEARLSGHKEIAAFPMLNLISCPLPQIRAASLPST